MFILKSNSFPEIKNSMSQAQKEQIYYWLNKFIFWQFNSYAEI